MIDRRFPLFANQGFRPEEFVVARYRERTAALKVAGGAVVSGSVQRFDQGYLLDALAQLGPGLVGRGVRAVRFNLRRGDSASPMHLDRLARRVHDLAGMHTELYVDARDLPALADILADHAVGIDHLGLHADGLPHLLNLVEQGVRVKATGFGRVELDTVETIRAILDTDPTAPMVASDPPSSPRPASLRRLRPRFGGGRSR